MRWQAGDVSYRRLGEMFEGFRRFLAEQRAAGVAMRLLAENDTVGSAERTAAYLRFEAMANEVYRPYGYRWHASMTPAAAPRRRCARFARSTRGCCTTVVERSGTGTTSSPAAMSRGPGRCRARPTVVPLDSAVTAPGQLVVFRRQLRRWAEMLAGSDDAQAILIAVGEAVTNALEHGPRQYVCGPG